MKMSYATKRDVNGNRYILIVDHSKKEYSTTAAHWFCKDDFIEISKKDRRRILEAVENANYTERAHLDAGIE